MISTSIILFLILLILVIFTFVLFNKKLFSPSFLVVTGFAFSTMFLILNEKKWGVNLSLKTICIILVGIIFFIIGEVMFKKASFNSIGIKCKTLSIKNSLLKPFLIIIFDLFLIYFLIHEIHRLGNLADNLIRKNGIMYAYKYVITYTNNDLNSLLKQLLKFSNWFGYIYLFILATNISIKKYKKNIKQLIFDILPVFLSVVLIFLRGNRINLISYVVAFIFLINLFSSNKNIKKTLISISAVIVLFLLSFYFTATLVGRKSNLNFFDYISNYIGGSINLFDLYLKKPVIPTYKFSEVFPGLYQNMFDFGFVHETIKKQLEFRNTITRIELGNVYTSFRRFYSSLGVFGVGLFSFLQSIIFNFLKLKSQKSKLLLILFSSLLYCLPLVAIEDQFYINCFSIGYLLDILILIICYIFIFKINFSLKTKGNI